MHARWMSMVACLTVTFSFVSAAVNADTSDLDTRWSAPKYLYHLVGRQVASNAHENLNEYKHAPKPKPLGRSEYSYSDGTTTVIEVDWVSGPCWTKREFCQTASSRGAWVAESFGCSGEQAVAPKKEQNYDILKWIFVALIFLVLIKFDAGRQKTAQAGPTPDNPDVGSDATVGVTPRAEPAPQIFNRDLNTQEIVDASEARTVEDAAKILQRVIDPDPAKQDLLKARRAIEIIKIRVRTLGWTGVPATETFLNFFGFGDAGIRNMERAANRKQLESGEDVDIAKATWTLQIAQCGEHAELLAKLLDRAGVNDVEVIVAQDPKKATSNHCFVAVGRQPGSDPHDPRKWGHKVFVADSYGADDKNGGGKLTSDMNVIWDTGAYFGHGNRKTAMIHRPGKPRQWITK